MPSKSIIMLEKAIDINPFYENAYYHLGNTYFRKCDFDDAINSYNKIIEINADYARVYYKLAQVYRIKKQYSLAWENIYKAQELEFKVPERFIEKLKSSQKEPR